MSLFDPLPMPRGVRLNHPCGRMIAPKGWGRDRATSKRLVDHELWLVWRGRGWMATEIERFELRPGFCAWMRPGGIYDAGSDPADPLGFTYLHFSLRAPARPREFFRVDDLGFFEAATDRIVKRVQPVPSSDWGMAVEGRPDANRLLAVVLEQLLAMPDASAPQTEQGLAGRLDGVAGRLRTTPELDRSMAELASECGVTPEHFSRAFRIRFGVSPQQFRVRARLDRARFLLAESGLSVAEVAERLGYSDPFSFSKQYKRFLGISPSRDRGRGPALSQ